MKKVAAALAILRGADDSVSLYKVAKKTGIVKKVVKALGGTIKGTGEAAERAFTEAGLPGAGKVMRYAPHAALAYGGYKAYQSPTGQRVRYKVREMRARHAMRKAMKQRGYQ